MMTTDGNRLRPFFFRTGFSLLFVFSLGWVLTGCSDIDVQPGKISKITVRKIGDGVILLDVDIAIVNHSTRKIVVRQLSSDIFLETEKIGNVTTEEKVFISSSTEQIYRVPVKVEHENIGKIGKVLVGSVFHGGRIELEMKGVLQIRSGIILKKIRFDQKQKVPLLR